MFTLRLNIAQKPVHFLAFGPKILEIGILGALGLGFNLERDQPCTPETAKNPGGVCRSSYFGFRNTVLFFLVLVPIMAFKSIYCFSRVYSKVGCVL